CLSLLDRLHQVDAKYQLIKPIGVGAYGVVVSALNTENGQKVAIKKITRAFEDLVDAKRILREITLLRKFSHDNIISIVDILVPPSSEEFEDVYIVSELMETDLHRIINTKQELTPDHVQYFLYQILRALKYMHSSNVLHRDLKPSNLLLNSNCDLKVCDLGLARDIESGCQELTEYVVTRWYRAPEIMLACQEYSKAIDVWSVGCIFAELMLRRPFFPGDNYIDQLTIICDKLGKPKENELAFVSTEKARRFILKLPATIPKCLRDQFPTTASDEALDLLSKMLEFSPETRISVDDALRHPFMRNLHAVKEEPVANFEFCFAFESEVPSKHRLQDLMWEEMRRYHPEQGPWRGKRIDSAVSSPGTDAHKKNVFPLLRLSARAFGRHRGETTTTPLGRSPINASPANSEGGSSSVAAGATPSDGVANPSLAQAGQRDRGEDNLASAMLPPGEPTQPNGSCGLAARAVCSAAAPATRTTRSIVVTKQPTAAAGASVGITADGVQGSRSTPVVRPGIATISLGSTTIPAAPPFSPVTMVRSSPIGFTRASGAGSGRGSPRARTRATARARVIKGRTTAHTSAQESSSANSSGSTGDASEVVMTTAEMCHIPKPKAVASVKRQRTGRTAGTIEGDARTACTDTKPDGLGGSLLLTRDAPAESKEGGSSGGKSCYQGAPVDGSSEFLCK
ncbi:unnamed protein product, partial [Hapterophycus canaliculatus]